MINASQYQISNRVDTSLRSANAFGSVRLKYNTLKPTALAYYKIRSGKIDIQAYTPNYTSQSETVAQDLDSTSTSLPSPASVAVKESTKVRDFFSPFFSQWCLAALATGMSEAAMHANPWSYSGSIRE